MIIFPCSHWLGKMELHPPCGDCHMCKKFREFVQGYVWDIEAADAIIAMLDRNARITKLIRNARMLDHVEHTNMHHSDRLQIIIGRLEICSMIPDGMSREEIIAALNSMN